MQYRSFNTRRRTVQCGVVVFTHDYSKFAMVLQESGKWSIPKGHLEENEEPFHGALRELREETGLLLAPLAPPKKSYTSSRLYSPKSMPLTRFEVKGKFRLHNNKIFYIIRLLDPAPHLKPLDTTEIKDAMWVTFERLQKLLNSQPQRCNSSLRFTYDFKLALGQGLSLPSDSLIV